MNVGDVTLAVMAGGESARMGRPKSRLLVNERPMLEHLLDRFGWRGPTVLVVAPDRERPMGALRFGRVCVDHVALQGPLRGVLTALDCVSTQFVVIAAVDMPLVGLPHLSELVREIERRPDVIALMPAHSFDGGRQVEPFPSIFHVGAANEVRARLARGERSIVRLSDDPRFATVDVNWEPEAWLNLNHPTDLPLLAQYGLRIQ